MRPSRKSNGENPGEYGARWGIEGDVATLRMNLQPGTRPFPDRDYTGTMAAHRDFRPLPSYRLRARSTETRLKLYSERGRGTGRDHAIEVEAPLLGAGERGKHGLPKEDHQLLHTPRSHPGTRSRHSNLDVFSAGKGATFA